MAVLFRYSRFFSALLFVSAVGNITLSLGGAKAASALTRDRVYYGGCVAVDDRLVNPRLRLKELYPEEEGGSEVAIFGAIASAFIQPFISNTLTRFGAALRRASGADGSNVVEVSATRAIETMRGESAACIQFVRGDFFDSPSALRASEGMKSGLPASIEAELQNEGILLKGKPEIFLEMALKGDYGRNALTLAPTYFTYGATLRDHSSAKKSRGLVTKVQFYPVGVAPDHPTTRGTFIALGAFKTGEYRQFDVLPAGVSNGPPPFYEERKLSQFHRLTGPETTGKVHRNMLESEKNAFHKSIGEAPEVTEFHENTNEKGDFDTFHSRLAAFDPELPAKLHARIKEEDINAYYDERCTENPLVQIDDILDIRKTRSCGYFAAFEKESEWFQHFYPPLAADDDTPREEALAPAPYNLKVTLVETRNINQFLLFLSDVFAGAAPAVETALVQGLTPTGEATRLQNLTTELTARTTYDTSLKDAWDKIDAYCKAPEGDSNDDRARRRTLALAALSAQATSNLNATKIGLAPPFASPIPQSALEGGSIKCPK